jgi:multidrug efflux pump subunit AcrB
MGEASRANEAHKAMVKFLLWCILLVFCWPLALLALVLYPIIWLLLLPFRVVGVAVGGALDLVSAIIFLPARVLRAI